MQLWLSMNYVSQGTDGADQVTTNPDGNKSPTSSRALSDWVKEVAALTQAGARRVVRRFRSRARSSDQRGGRRRNTDPLNQEKRPGCYLHRSNPNDVARTEQLTFVCTPTQRRSGADQQLDRAGGNLREAARMARRLDARAHDVRGAVRDGPAGVAVLEGRRGAYRQHLRRAEHANHDADGRARRSSSLATRTTSIAAFIARST